MEEIDRHKALGAEPVLPAYLLLPGTPAFLGGRSTERLSHTIPERESTGEERRGESKSSSKGVLLPFVDQLALPSLK